MKYDRGGVFYSIFFFSLVFLFFTTFPITTHASIYAPGETLEPDCVAGTLNCGVDPSLGLTLSTINSILNSATSSGQNLNINRSAKIGGPAYALKTTASSSYIATGNTNITISLWFYSTASSFSSFVNLLNNGNGSSGYNIGLGYSCGGGSYVQVVRNGLSCFTEQNKQAPFTINTWQHVVYTVDSTAAYLYTNGVLYGGGPGKSNATPPLAPSGGSLIIGNSGSAYVDDVIIWNRALTAAEISDLYANGSPPKRNPTDTFPSTGTPLSTNLTGMWHFDEGDGLVTYDSSVNAHTLIMFSSTGWTNGIVGSFDDSGTNNLIVRGKVGIGTPNPNNILDIFSPTKAAIGFSGSVSSTYKWTMGMDVSNGGRFSIASSSALGTFDRFVIGGSGNVGIGTTSPAYTLHIEKVATGTIAYFKAGANTCSLDPANVGGLSCSSDERLKTNIQTLASSSTSSTALDKLVALRPVTYNWISDSQSSSSAKYIGFIAQEVLPLFPDLVSTDNGGNYQLSYSGFIPYIVGAIQDLNSKIVSSVANIKSLFVAELYIQDKICADEVCVTKDQFKQILLNAGGTVTSSVQVSNPIISQDPVVNSIDGVTASSTDSTLASTTDSAIATEVTIATTSDPITEMQATTTPQEAPPVIIPTAEVVAPSEPQAIPETPDSTNTDTLPVI